MPDVSLLPARTGDATLLAGISKLAFESDIICGAPSKGGPPGYDSPHWQMRMIRTASAYLKIEAHGQTVGGLIVFAQGGGRYNLGRIFIQPKYQRQGIGIKAVQLVCDRFTDARVWWLDTPAWNIRTRSFYEKLGFVLIETTGESLVFEKTLP